ncbi:MAG: caspase family protein [Gemmatimonadota bacterium]|nr:caspase family protein [Gemmatimonadota bacterium]
MSDFPAGTARRALLIGIDAYPKIRQLSGCVNDVRLMRTILVDNFGFAPDLLMVLENGAATRVNILAAFEALIAATGHDDIVVIHYAGHGSQMTDLEGDEPSGYDSTIMPFDTEGWQGDNRDITDDEIGLMLDALGVKTSYITLIFDSCHSGTITRDAVGANGRSIQADTRPASELKRHPVAGVARATTRSAGPSGWMPMTEKYVLISGCRDEETSFEYQPPEGEGKVSHGALTYFLSQQLKQATPGTTYRDIFERAAARVNAVNNAQHPQMEGKADREIFGVREVTPTRFLRVTARDAGTVTLSAGAAHGVTTGSVYAIHPQGTKEPASSTALGAAEVTEVGVVSSQARVTSESGAGAIAPDARAFETRHAFGDFRLGVTVLDTPGTEAAALRALLEGSTLLKAVSGGEPAAVTVRLLPTRGQVAETDPVPRAGVLRVPMWATFGENGDLLMPLKPTGDVKTIRENLETIARYRQALALENPNPDSRLRGKFALDLLKLDASGEWVVAEPEVAGGQVVYTEGDTIGFRVNSDHDTAVFVALVDFEPTGAVTPLRPPPRAPAAQEKLGPGIRYRIGPEMKPPPRVSWAAGFPFVDSVDHTGEAEAIETVKLFITEQQSDFSVLEQKGVRGDAAKVSPLSNLLQRTFQGSPTRGIEMAPVTEEDWTTVARSFVVRRRTTAALKEDGAPLVIGGATLGTKGLSGTVSTYLGKKGREEAALQVGSPLTSALADAGIDVRQTVAITGARETGPATRSAGEQPGFELTLSAPGEGFGQMVMSADELGVVSWHFAPPAAAAGTRGGAGAPPASRTYVIPRGVPAEQATGAGTRGIITAIGTKILKEMIFPLIDPIIGEVSATFVNRLEQHRWPYRIRAFGPGDFTTDTAAPLDGEGWSWLSGGRALLMVHGTFSRSHLAFGHLPGKYMEELHRRYGGRVFAFDHFTLSHDPRENVRRFLAAVPEAASLDLDIICHSRGGLVSRMLSEKQSEFSLGSRKLRVGKVVFVGAPNAGTGLADPANLNNVLDVFTNLLNFLPDNGVTEVMTMIVSVLKQVATGAMAGLEGLQSMRPDGDFAKWMNTGARVGDTKYYALAANVTPKDPGLRHFVVSRGLNMLIKGDNDLVVPTQGVFAENGSGFFPIEEKLVLEGDEAVSHTKYFENAAVQGKIMEWLGSGA